MLVEQISLSLWLLLAVVFLIASFVHRRKPSQDILPKVRAEDEPVVVVGQIPFIGHAVDYVTQGPVYLYRLW